VTAGAIRSWTLSVPQLGGGLTRSVAGGWACAWGRARRNSTRATGSCPPAAIGQLPTTISRPASA